MFFNFCFNIAQVDDDLIAIEVHESVSKNCVELNEFPNDGKINNTYGVPRSINNSIKINIFLQIEEYFQFYPPSG